MEGEAYPEEVLDTVFNNVEEFIVVISPTLEIEEVNQALLEKMGYSRQEVIGKKCYEVFQKPKRSL